MRRAVRWFLAAAFLLDGVLHWLFPAVFAAIVPPWVPAPMLVVLATGAAAFAGGAGLLVAPLRRAAGIGLAAYCAAVWPANIHHALADIGQFGWPYHAVRLPLQPVIAWACLWSGDVIDWPFAGAGQAATRETP